MKANKDVLFPECWEEVTKKEFAELLRLRELLITHGYLSLLDVKRSWTDYVLRNRGFSCTELDYRLVVNRLAYSLDWQWNVSSEGVVSLTFDSTVNLIPFIGKAVGPASHGGDLTFSAFQKGMTLVTLYQREGNVVFLEELLQLLYKHPKGKRVRCSPAILFGVYAWFASFAAYLTTGVFLIDGKEVSFAPLFATASGNGDGADGGLGMNSILFSVAESGVFGNAGQVGDTLLIRVMLKLLGDKQKADALEAELRKKRK